MSAAPPFTGPVEEGHVLDLAGRLRVEDVAELAAAAGEDPQTGLRSALARSRRAFTLFGPDGRPLAITGVAPHRSVGWLEMVWLLGAEVPRPWARWYLPATRLILEDFAGEGRVLVAVVDARHVKALRWLSWLGFTVVRRLPHYGAAGLPFVVVAWKRGAAWADWVTRSKARSRPCSIRSARRSASTSPRCASPSGPS